MENLIQWYNINKRNLPWRNNPTPYNIWVSEIILQQTQMSRGVQYYNNFIIAFPDVHSLAMADEKDVLLLWQGLGYYSRARNMLKAAKQIVQNHNGVFPQTYDGLKSLQGIGDYTACAILSIALKKQFVVVDANVLRIITRIEAIEHSVASSQLVKTAKKRAMDLMKGFNPADFNQAMMELGALVCKPLNPQCKTCPLTPLCKAFAQGLQNVLPIKRTKPLRTKRYFHYFICLNKSSDFLFTKRVENDVWRQMYEFPMIESQSNETPEYTDIEQLCMIELVPEIPIIMIAEKKHILSHREIHAFFYVVGCNISRNENMHVVSLTGSAQYPVHNLMKYGLKALEMWLK